VEGCEKDASAHKPVDHRLVLSGVSGFAIVASRAHGAKRYALSFPKSSAEPCPMFGPPSLSRIG
jgi:hypothetical protein